LIAKYCWNWYKHWNWADFGYMVLDGTLWGGIGPYFGCLSKVIIPLGAAIGKVVGVVTASVITYFIVRAAYRGKR